MASPPSTRRPPASFFALGHAPMPSTLTANGITYTFLKLFKHDFFAATALYQQSDPTSPQSSVLSPQSSRLAVLKFQRTHPFFLFPMKWLGAHVARREIATYQALQHLPGIPAFLGPVDKTGFLHDFIPGADLAPSDSLTPQFFADLHALLTAIHAHRIAYVDTNKRENILRGTDDRPYLIDFQISYNANRLPWRFIPFLLTHFQHKDWYHFYKHKTRLIPQHCTPEDFARATPPFFIRLHRLIAQPFIRLRRKFLSRYNLTRTH